MGNQDKHKQHYGSSYGKHKKHHGHGSHKHGEAYLAYMGSNAGGSDHDKKSGLSVYNAGFLKSVSTVQKPAAKSKKAYAASHRSNYSFKPSKFVKSSRKKYK